VFSLSDVYSCVLTFSSLVCGENFTHRLFRKSYVCAKHNFKFSWHVVAVDLTFSVLTANI
jgi:hypothetical protein